MPTVGLANHGQIPYPGVAGQSQLSGRGMVGLRHPLFHGMACQTLANSRLQPNQEGPIKQALASSDLSVQAHLDKIRDMIKVLASPKPSELELDRSRGSPFSAYINAFPLPKLKIPT
uniref:Uncharacterized protein n=1 Tax=Cannabis sativa TaxID=3483 RepID=A0A803Q749_CANSA